MHRNRICSFVPAEKNAFPTFCSGSLLIPNCISPIPTGRISTMLRWMPQSHTAFVAVMIVFFAAASWESFRLFKSSFPALGAALWTMAFAFLLLWQRGADNRLLFGICAAGGARRGAPARAVGLPPVQSLSNRLLNGIYGVAIMGCFLAIAVLFQRSPLYLFSVMAIVWIADIGAYFSGKA